MRGSAADTRKYSPLRRRVFGSAPEQRVARANLETIVHPKIRELFVEQIAKARKRSNAEAVILDAAVLYEAGWQDLCAAGA